MLRFFVDTGIDVFLSRLLRGQVEALAFPHGGMTYPILAG